MNSAAASSLVALTIQCGLGLVVFFANRKRRSNQCFLILSLAIVAWMGSLYCAFATTNQGVAEFSIREASAAAALIFAGFNLLRLSIREEQKSWGQILRRSRFWLVVTFLIIVLCQTKFFLQGARHDRWSAEHLFMDRRFMSILFTFILGIIVLIGCTWRDLRQKTGGERAELGFVLIGGIAALLSSLPLALRCALFLNPPRYFRLHHFVLLFSASSSPTALRHGRSWILAFFFRRAISYGLLAAYLLAIYASVWWLVATALRSSVADPHGIAHVMAAIVVAFAMAPARGVSQRLAERLFVSSRGLDFRRTMNQAVAILKSVTTLRDLLTRFGETIAQAVDTDRVMILLLQKDVYAQRYPPPTPASRIDLPKNHALLRYLQSSGQPIVLDELHRIRPTPESDRVGKHMQHLNLAVVMGIFTREQLEGVMLLGPRLSGRIYGRAEQEALQALCGQLAVAIENAELFTEVQERKNLQRNAAGKSYHGRDRGRDRRADHSFQQRSGPARGVKFPGDYQSFHR